MILNYNQHAFCVNCDWLTFSVRISDIANFEMNCPDGYRIELCQGNNIFQNRALIYGDDGAKLLTLLWCPFSKLLHKDIMTVQVANECLYKSGILFCFSLLKEITDVSFNSLSRLDICCDFEADDYCLMFIRSLWLSDYYVQAKSEGSAFWHSTKSDTVNFASFCHCMSWGSKSSEIKVKLYNKSREIGVADGVHASKPYIVDEWANAGLNIKRVWRLEFSMMSSGQLVYKRHRLTLEDVSSSAFLIDMFLTLYNTRFICRVNEGRRIGHKNNDTRVKLLDLPMTVSELEWYASGDDKTLSEPIKLLRKALAMLETDICRCSLTVFDSVADVVLTLCRDKSVYGYFISKMGNAPSLYIDDLRAQCGGGIVDKVAAPSVSWL